jgi:L-rhamnose mutarotase
MYRLLELYERPYNPLEPVVCLDEMSKQLLDHKIPPIPLTSDHGIREDSEYIRKGTRNLFVAVEPKGKKRFIKVTNRRTKQDFANVVKELIESEYSEAIQLQLVIDNLNTHFQNSFYETFEPDEAKRILEKIERSPKECRLLLRQSNFITLPNMEVG